MNTQKENAQISMSVYSLFCLVRRPFSKSHFVKTVIHIVLIGKITINLLFLSFPVCLENCLENRLKVFSFYSKWFELNIKSSKNLNRKILKLGEDG